MQISGPSLQSGKVGGITIGVLPDRRHCALAWDVCRYWQVLHKQLNYTLDTASGSSGTCARWGSADCYGSTPGGSAAAATLLAPQAFARLTCHWRRLCPCPRPCPCLQAKFNFPAANYRKDRKLTKLLQGIETLQDAARSAAAAQGRLCVTSATYPRLPTYPHSAAARSYAQRTIPMKACFPPPLQARPQSAACCARGETP